MTLGNHKMAVKRRLDYRLGIDSNTASPHKSEDPPVEKKNGVSQSSDPRHRQKTLPGASLSTDKL